MVRDVIAYTFNPRSHLYDLRGRGRDREARDIKTAINGGYDWCFVADIQACFDHVSPTALYQLPIPHSVIRSNLDKRFMRWQRSNKGGETTLHALEDNTECDGIPPRHWVQRGILQGSPASSIILASLLNDVCESLRVDCRVFVLVDDILVAAKTMADALVVERTLVTYFREHRAGPFVLEGQVSWSRIEPIERAGYRFAYDGSSQDVWIGPSRANCKKMHVKTESILANATFSPMLRARMAEQHVRRWSAGFSAADNNLEELYARDDIDTFRRSTRLKRLPLPKR